MNNLPAMPLTYYWRKFPKFPDGRDITHNLAKICTELVNHAGGILTEFVIPVMYKQVDKEDKDCSCGRLPHTLTINKN